jgi:hypothetical protein
MSEVMYLRTERKAAAMLGKESWRGVFAGSIWRWAIKVEIRRGGGV